MLPKILHPHDEKENRSIETQLNEAKKLIAILFVLFTVVFLGNFMIIALFLLATFYGIDGVKQITQVITSLQMIALVVYLFACLIHSCKKTTKDVISGK